MRLHSSTFKVSRVDRQPFHATHCLIRILKSPISGEAWTKVPSGSIHLNREDFVRPTRNLRSAALRHELYEIAADLPSWRTTIDALLAVGIVGSLAWSGLPVIASSAESRRKEWQEKAWEKQGQEGVKWGVATLVSFLPVFNWLSWVFLGLQNEERVIFYYAMAALYGAPQIEAGFQQKPFAVLALVAGIIHVQIERIAEEREVQSDAPQLSESFKQRQRQAGKLLGDTARGFAEAVDTAEQKADIKQEVLRGKPSKRSKREEQADLRQWDDRYKRK